MSFYGRECVKAIDWFQAEVDFWERWSCRLHADEARAIINDDIGIIKRQLKPDFPTGEWMELASNFWIRPHEPKFTHRGWRITYDIRDFRVRLPRRVPAMYEPPELDDQGYPVAHDLEAIKAATEDGNYTASHALSVPDTDESVDPFTQRRITRESGEQRLRAQGELLSAAEDLRSALDERVASNPQFRMIAGRDIARVKNEIDRLIRRQRKRAA